MSAAAGTAGTFFRLGDATHTTKNCCIHDFAFQYLNYASLDGTKNIFDCFNTNDTWISNIYADAAQGVAGFIKLGDTASGTYGTYASRTIIDNAQILLRSVCEGSCFDLQQTNVLVVSSVTVSLVTLSVTKACKGIYIHPVGADADGGRRTCDAGRWHSCEFNFNLASHNIDHILVVDGSQGIPVDHWFTGCVFDHCNLGAIKFLVSAGAHASARIAEFSFTSCHALMNAAGAILIDNTGARDISQIHFIGGDYSAETLAAVRMVGTSQLVDITFDGVGFIDTELTTTKAVIDASGCRVLVVVGCKAMARLDAGASKFTYFVKFLAACPRFIIMNNEGRELQFGTVFGNGFLTDLETRYKVLANNSAPANFCKHQITTTNATATSIANIPLIDATINLIQVVVLGVKTDGTDRATYNLSATYYRTAAGTPTQVGATYNSDQQESNAAWNAAFAVSGNTVQVKVTGVAATTINWGCTTQITTVNE
jgi:hypothetical protein